jgi:intein-encoded DNA endonuclease-like protein
VNAIVSAYVAGFFDGEGNVSIHRKSIGKLRDYEGIEVSISNTRIEPLVFIQDNFKFGKISLNPRGKVFPNSKDVYRWRIGAKREIKCFLEAVSPYVIVKRKQLSYCLDWLKSH